MTAAAPPQRAPALHLYQIVHSDATAAAVEPGFEPLDNRGSAHADWYEYAPIRRHLLGRPLDDGAFYGFFSTRFRAKTGHGAETIRALAAARGSDADVLLFSAHPNQIAFFANVFEQGDYFHPGLADAAQQWLAQAGMPAPPLRTLLMDASRTVYCNYFVARPAFWRTWLALGETLWAVCEGEPTPLQQQLTAPAPGYHGGAQLKVFVVERIASLLLALQPQWRSVAADPYAAGRWPTPALQADPTDALAACALKHAMHGSPQWPQYASAFGALRRRVLSGPPA